MYENENETRNINKEEWLRAFEEERKKNEKCTDFVREKKLEFNNK